MQPKAFGTFPCYWSCTRVWTVIFRPRCPRSLNHSAWKDGFWNQELIDPHVTRTTIIIPGHVFIAMLVDSQCPPLAFCSELPLAQTDRFLRMCKYFSFVLASHFSQNDLICTYRLQLVNWMFHPNHTSPVKLGNIWAPKTRWPRVAHIHTVKCFRLQKREIIQSTKWKWCLTCDNSQTMSKIVWWHPRQWAQKRAKGLPKPSCSRCNPIQCLGIPDSGTI